MRCINTSDLPELLTQGATYVDVRTPEEYGAGHIPDAYNLPVAVGSVAGLTSNPDFVRVALASFAPSNLLVIGCHTGSRARNGVSLLAAAGFAKLILDSQGWDGSRDAFGRLTPGWSRLARPQEEGQPSERSYAWLSGNLSRLSR